MRFIIGICLIGIFATCSCIAHARKQFGILKRYGENGFCRMGLMIGVLIRDGGGGGVGELC